MMTEEIDNALGLAPYIIEPPIRVSGHNGDEMDLDYARGNLLEAAEKGKEALDAMIAIADQSQHPRAYEVVNSLIKTIADVSGTLAELKMKRQRLNSDDGGVKTTNNLFVGSTAELQKMLSELKNDD